MVLTALLLSMLLNRNELMNINLLDYLSVYRVSENAACKMPLDNLATVFGPTVVGYSSAEPTMNDIMVQTKLQQLVNLCVCVCVCVCACVRKFHINWLHLS